MDVKLTNKSEDELLIGSLRQASEFIVMRHRTQQRIAK